MENRQAITFYIKNMICSRCIYVVKNILIEAHYNVHSIRLGEVVVTPSLVAHSEEKLALSLQRFGLSLLQERQPILMEKIKLSILKYIYENDRIDASKLSDYLSTELDMPYTHIRKLFKEQTAMTIEKFYIQHKVERTKELLQYGELSIKEIAYQLGYSSLQHLSNQFKAITGFSPKAYKEAAVNQRVPVDLIFA